MSASSDAAKDAVVPAAATPTNPAIPEARAVDGPAIPLPSEGDEDHNHDHNHDRNHDRTNDEKPENDLDLGTTDDRTKDIDEVSQKTSQSNVKDGEPPRRRVRKAPPPHFQDHERRRRLHRLQVDSADSADAIVQGGFSTRDQQDQEKAANKRWYAGYSLKDDLDPEKKKSYGMFARLTRFRPIIEDEDMSLIQILVANDDPSHPLQTLEAGWQRNGHIDAELFIFFTTNGYAEEDGVGIQGYVQKDNHRGYVFLDRDPRNVWRPGDFMPASHIGGTQQLVTLQWHMVKGKPKMADGWYLAIDGIWNGYFPLRFFERGAPDKTKTLADHANKLDFYGEVYDDDYDRAKPDPPEAPQVRTTADMGSGRWPIEGWTYAAFIDNIQRLTSKPGLAVVWENADETTFVNWFMEGMNGVDPFMYGIHFIPSSGTTSGSVAYIGGPGAAVPLGKWEQWEDISGTDRILRGPSFDALGPICMTERALNLTDVFMIGTDGRVWNCWQNEQNDWSGFNNRSEWSRLYFGDDNTPKLDIRAKLAVVARTPKNLDVFVVAKDGKVYTCTWTADNGFVPWKDISGESRFPSGAPITAVSRMPQQIDVFINAGGSRLLSSWWRDDLPPDNSDWAAWEQRDIGNMSFPPSADPLVLVRRPESLDVFLAGSDGYVYTAGWLDGTSWTPFGRIGTSAPNTTVTPHRETRFFSGGKLAGLPEGADRMDLFAISNDQQLYTCHYTTAGGWSSVNPDRNGKEFFWTPLGFGTKTKPPPTVKIFDALSDVVAVRRRPSRDMDVLVTGFWPGTNTIAYTTHVYRAHYNALFDRWSTTGNSGDGWDKDVGGGEKRQVWNDHGFRIGATSRNGSGLTVVSIMTDRRVIAAEYVGLPGLL